MNSLNEPASRDANGRFVPGQSGNPAGKKPGTRNRATVLREALDDGEDRTVARIVIDRALAGDAVAARFVVGRLMPRPRGREVELALPEGQGAGDVVAGYDVTLRAMAAGEITPDEALTVTRILDGRLRALKAREKERKLADRGRDGKKPSPSGRGQGEGLRRIFTTAGKSSPAAPHPNPLPKEEGMGDFRARLLHSTCILQSPGWRADVAPGRSHAHF